MGTNLRILLLTIAALALAWFGLLEIGMAYPVAGWLYLLTAIAFATALVRVAPVRSQVIRIAALMAVCALIAALSFVDWTSRKPFLRALARVQVGMTESQVRLIMGGYLEGTGMPASPFETSTNRHSTITDVASGSQYPTSVTPAGEMTIDDSLVFRHSHDGRFNADWGIVRLSKSRVVGVEFCPD